MEEQRQAQSVSPMNPTPVDTANKVAGDLYAAITAEDEVPTVEPPKKRVSHFISLITAFMRLTFWVDLTRRSNEGVFRFLGTIWTIFMAVIYVSGLLTLFLCLTSFVQLPLKLEKFFNEQNIQFDSLEMADYSLSQINIQNLHDSQNLYQIPNVQIHSTFGDFLRNKILSVDVDGPKLNFKTGQKENSLKWLLDLVSHFNGSEDKKIDINSLNVSNAVLTIFGKHLTIPVSFTVLGKYDQNMQTSITFGVNEEFLNLQGTMQISGEGQEKTAEIKITSGHITLPNSPEEDIKGEITLTIKNNEIQSIKADLIMEYVYSVKNILLNLEKNEQQGFDGELTYTQKNTTTEATSSEFLTDFTLKVKDLKLNEANQITTQSPITLDIRRLTQNTLSLSGVSAELNGHLLCTLSEGQCRYQLNQAAVVQMAEFNMTYKDQKIILKDNQPFKITPKKEETLIIQFASPELQMSFLLKDLQSFGYINENDLNMMAQQLSLEGTFSQKQGETKLSVDLSGGKLKTPKLALENMTFTSQNIYDVTSPIRLTSDSVSSASNFIKKPLSLELISVSAQTSIKAKVIDTDILLQAQGILRPFEGTFSGNFTTSSIILEDLPYQPYEISNLFPKNMSDPSGKVRLMGQLNYANENNIFGKLFVGFENLSFTFNDTKIENLNTVVALKSLVPFVSAPNQQLFIGNIQNKLDLSNLTTTFQMDNKNLRLLNINAQFANQPLSLSSAIISMQNPEETLTFKSNSMFAIENLIPFMDLSDIAFINGEGSLTIPLQISKENLNIPSVSLKLSQVELRRPNGPSLFQNIFTPESTSYLIQTGRMYLSQDNQLQTEFSGWLLPQRIKKDFSQSNIELQNALFLKSTPQSVPKVISDRLNLLFHQENNL